MEKETGCIHVYYGDGKGKTTTGMGLITRAAGYERRVLLYQFMKNNKTSERKILERVENITIIDGLETEKFSFQMTQDEKEARRKFYETQFKSVTKRQKRKSTTYYFWTKRCIPSAQDCWTRNWCWTFKEETKETGSHPDRKYPGRPSDRPGRLCIGNQKNQTSL